MNSDVISIENSKKKLRITVELCDSDNEFEEWFAESVPEKLGLCPHSVWMHPMNLKWLIDGEYIRVCVPICYYPDKFFKYFRMSVTTYEYILDSIREDITKYSNRPSILPGE